MSFPTASTLFESWEKRMIVYTELYPLTYILPLYPNYLSLFKEVHYEKYNWDPGDPGEQLRDF